MKTLQDRERFIEMYVCQFMASLTAVHYTEYCQRGWEGQPHLHELEDAQLLAEETWEAWKEMRKG